MVWVLCALAGKPPVVDKLTLWDREIVGGADFTTETCFSGGATASARGRIAVPKWGLDDHDRTQAFVELTAWDEAGPFSHRLVLERRSGRWKAAFDAEVAALYLASCSPFSFDGATWTSAFEGRSRRGREMLVTLVRHAIVRETACRWHASDRRLERCERNVKACAIVGEIVDAYRAPVPFRRVDGGCWSRQWMSRNWSASDEPDLCCVDWAGGLASHGSGRSVRTDRRSDGWRSR